MKGANKHHRKTKYFKGKTRPGNLSNVSVVKHRAWHILFDGTRTTESIVRELNDVWINPAYKLVIEKRKRP